MTRRTIEDLIAQAGVSLPDQSVGAIKPADVRNMITDFLDTITPMYGGLEIVSRVQTVTTTPAALIFQNSIVSFPPEWTVDPLAGTLARVLPSIGAMNSKFDINGNVVGGNNGDVTIVLYRGNTPTNYRSNIGTRGAGSPVAFAFTVYDFVKADATYKLMVSTRTAGDYTFSNVQFIGANVPIRTVNVPAPAIIDGVERNSLA